MREAGVPLPKPVTIAGEASPAPGLQINAFQAQKLQKACADQLGLKVEEDVILGDGDNGVALKLMLIPPGTFQMGAPQGEEDRIDNEGQHEVTISKPFYLGKYEVTRGQFRKFVEETQYLTEPEKAKMKINWKSNQFFAQTDEHPVICVTWNDAKRFCTWLTERGKKEYRLPTEAEWEYACRAGTITRFQSGNSEGSLKKVARFNDDKGTGPVGQLAPNAWGLFDMHGNAREWCQDWYGPYRGEKETDPMGPAETGQRVFRGGSWNFPSQNCRSAYRSWLRPAQQIRDLGFRVAFIPTGNK
jgi:formylglycine-generating enzyme required for sulfatase activity